MNRIILLILSLLIANVSLYGKSYVRPEAFGAIGDGVTDDTKAIQKAILTECPLLLENQYRITQSLNLCNDIYGSGTIIFGKNDVSIYCTNDGVSIEGLTFDFQFHEGKLLRIKGAKDINISQCNFLNVGNHQAEQSIGIILITGASSNIRIEKCRFVKCYASDKSSSAGVWVNFSNPEDRCHHIYIDRCYFDDFQPGKDADAIKVLGQNENVYMYVSNCEFRRCNKRALKFQARECYSKNNVIYVTRPMYCAIDFQRGNGISKNDQIIIDYDGISEINPNSGLLYRAVCIAQGNVKVINMDVKSINYIDNTHQVAVCFQTFKDYDNGCVKDVRLKRCHFDGMSSFISAFPDLGSIHNLKVKNTVYHSRIKSYDIILRDKIMYDSTISYKGTGGSSLGIIKNNKFLEACIINKK